MFLGYQGKAQTEIISLKNPSFESPAHSGGASGYSIEGWQDCGVVYFEDETPPDIHLGMERDPNSREGSFGVQQPASDGFTFLGFVIRDNESYESVSQRLSSVLSADKCYSFSIDLSRSASYVSPFPMRSSSKSYTKPAVLQIYGGAAYCGKRELLAETKAVYNTEWETYDFEFRPTKNHRYITLVAYYKVPVLVPYNGNLLLDNASEIVRIPCPGEELFAEEEKKPKVTKPAKKAKVEPKEIIVEKPVITKPKEKPVEVVKRVEPKMVINKGLDRANLKVGQTVKIKNLYFEADASEYNPKSVPALTELAAFLKFNDDIQIEIGGHTNTQPEDWYCDSLSTERAKSVAQFLLDNGIPISQLEYKGYGRREPLTEAKTRLAQARNQRVEIKILQIGDQDGE